MTVSPVLQSADLTSQPLFWQQSARKSDSAAIVQRASAVGRAEDSRSLEDYEGKTFAFRQYRNARIAHRRLTTDE